MKKINYFLYTLALFSILSCRDDSSNPHPEIPNGAFITGTVSNIVLNFEDLGNTAITADVEDKSGLIASYKVYATWVRDGVESDTVFVEEYTSFPVQVNLTATEIATAFDSTTAEFIQGDIFNFHSTITDNTPDANVYTSENISANVAGNVGQRQAMTYTGYVACPVAAEFIGDYDIEQLAGPVDPFFGFPYAFAPETVTVEAPNLITREMGLTYYTFSVNFEFLLLCNTVIVNRTASGVGCGGPGLGWVQDNPPATYDPNDDSYFEIFLIENDLNGCSTGITPGTILGMTKK